MNVKGLMLDNWVRIPSGQVCKVKTLNTDGTVGVGVGATDLMGFDARLLEGVAIDDTLLAGNGFVWNTPRQLWEYRTENYSEYISVKETEGGEYRVDIHVDNKATNNSIVRSVHELQNALAAGESGLEIVAA